MLGDFINRGLVMILGYAYPAFECFKAVEKNRVQIDELRFWCQYWIIVAVLSVIERFGDMLISWLPLYSEIKLVFIIYLWYPKTKGTSYVYESLLQPFVSKHETDIERKLEELRLRAWDLGIFYLRNCTQLGETAFFQVVHYVANQSSRLKRGASTEMQKTQQKQPGEQPGPPPPPTDFALSSSALHTAGTENSVSSSLRPRNKAPPSSTHRGPNNHNSARRWPPSAPPLPATIFRADAGSAESKEVVMRPNEAQIGFVEELGERGKPNVDSRPSPDKSPDEKLDSARLRLGRSKPER